MQKVPFLAVHILTPVFFRSRGFESTDLHKKREQTMTSTVPDTTWPVESCVMSGLGMRRFVDVYDWLPLQPWAFVFGCGYQLINLRNQATHAADIPIGKNNKSHTIYALAGITLFLLPSLLEWCKVWVPIFHSFSDLNIFRENNSSTGRRRGNLLYFLSHTPHYSCFVLT